MISRPLSANIYVPALPLLSEKFNVPTESINLTITLYLVFQALSPAWWGSLADAMGRRSSQCPHTPDLGSEISPPFFAQANLPYHLNTLCSRLRVPRRHSNVGLLAPSRPPDGAGYWWRVRHCSGLRRRRRHRRQKRAGLLHGYVVVFSVPLDLTLNISFKATTAWARCLDQHSAPQLVVCSPKVLAGGPCVPSISTELAYLAYLADFGLPRACQFLVPRHCDHALSGPSRLVSTFRLEQSFLYVS